jgi:DNA-binding MarR family transcriptional regulator
MIESTVLLRFRLELIERGDGGGIVSDDDWMLLTTHGQVLFYLAANPEATIPTIAKALDLSERRISVVLRGLRKVGMIRATRVGRRNVYEVNGAARFRHPTLAHVRLDQILKAFVPHDGAKVFFAPPERLDHPSGTHTQ